MIHLERGDERGTYCGLDYGAGTWIGESVTDPEEIHDVTCKQCLAASLRS